MVVFVCSKCNESLKKKNVERHFRTCHCPSVSCVDCSKSLTLQNFSSHTSCISEQEKYGKPNFQESAPKGALKQMDWTSSVHSRLFSFQTMPGVPTLMKKMILDSKNVPRKRNKFENFLRSSFKFARSDDIDALWQQISSQDIDSKSAESKNLSDSETKPSAGSDLTKSSGGLSQEDTNCRRPQSSNLLTQRSGDDVAYEKFGKIYKRFGKIMLLHLKQNQNKMKIKKLRRMTFDTFKKSEHFNGKNHSDDFLEHEFQRALKKKRHFVISDNQRKVSISCAET